MDFAISCLLVQTGRPPYPVLVHRAASLLHVSFRPRLATTPLRFANPSPPSGWVKDFHLQAVEHARHNRDRGEPRGSSPPTPPYIRVRIRRFTGLSTNGLFGVRARGSDGGLRRAGFGPLSSVVRASPFPTAPKASDLDFQPHGQLEVSTFKRLSSVQAFSETRSAYYAVS